MLHMHILALTLTAFVMAVLCLLLLVSVRLLAAKAIRFLVLAVGNAIDGEFLVLARGLQGKSVKTTLANAETTDMGQASAFSAFQSKAKGAIRSSLATNDVNFFSVTNEMTDRGPIDWRGKKATSASCLHYAT